MIHPRKCPCGCTTFTLEIISYTPITKPPVPPVLQRATCTQCGQYRLQTISEAETVGRLEQPYEMER
jgi:hypothetical protein